MAKHHTHTAQRTRASNPNLVERRRIESLSYKKLRAEAAEAGVFEVGMSKEEIREALYSHNIG